MRLDSMRSTQTNGTGISGMSSSETTVKNATVQIEEHNTSCSFIFFNKYYKTLFEDVLLRTRLIAIEVRVSPVASEFWFCVGHGVITVEVCPVAFEF